MAWYYYSGVTPLAVPVGGGEVVSVRPGEKVFVDPSIETRTDFRRLQRVLKRTSGPRVESVASVEVVVPVAGPTDLFSTSIVEGVKPGNEVQTPLVSALLSGDTESGKGDVTTSLRRIRSKQRAE